MKLYCGASKQQKRERRYDWHKFFAFIPRRVEDGSCRWLESIMRRDMYVARTGSIYTTYSDGLHKWEYKAINE